MTQILYHRGVQILSVIGNNNKNQYFFLFCGRRHLLLMTAMKNGLLAVQNYGYLTVIQKTSAE